MIEGIYIDGRPQISGLLVFPTLSGLNEIPVSFVVDSGSDSTLITSIDYEDYFDYSAATRYPLSDSTGFGAQIMAHLVPARLSLRHEDGVYSFHPLIIEVLRPENRFGDEVPPLSVLGRDILDQFSVTCDRTRGTVTIESPQLPEVIGYWPDEDNVTRAERRLRDQRLNFDGLTKSEALAALIDPATYPGTILPL